MIDFLDSIRPDPSPHRRDWISLFDSLVALPRITTVIEDSLAHDTARIWSAARGYQTTEIGQSLYVWRGDEVLFAVRTNA